jgi:hypothetical protein
MFWEYDIRIKKEPWTKNFSIRAEESEVKEHE